MEYILNPKLFEKYKNINNSKKYYLKNIKEKINNIDKYLEHAKKLHEIKYFFNAIITYKIANKLLTEIEEKRMNKINNNKGIEEFKHKKYNVFIISPDIANTKDKKIFDEISKEIELRDKIKKEERKIEKIEEYFKENRLNEKDIKSMLK